MAGLNGIVTGCSNQDPFNFSVAAIFSPGFKSPYLVVITDTAGKVVKLPATVYGKPSDLVGLIADSDIPLAQLRYSMRADDGEDLGAYLGRLKAEGDDSGRVWRDIDMQSAYENLQGTGLKATIYHRAKYEEEHRDGQPKTA